MHPARGTFGSLDSIAGTAATTYGRKGVGIGHHVSTHGGLHHDGNIGATATFSLKDTGAKDPPRFDSVGWWLKARP